MIDLILPPLLVACMTVFQLLAGGSVFMAAIGSVLLVGLYCVWRLDREWVERQR